MNALEKLKLQSQLRYVYFISYAHESGFGNSEVRLFGKPKALRDLNEIRDFITEEMKVKEVVILNYQLLRVEIEK